MPLAAPEPLTRRPREPGEGTSPGVADGTRARPVTSERRLADAVRALTIDAAERTRSGQVRVPLGMADVASVLWRRFLKFDAEDPNWPDRDRFVLSAGEGSTLLYALLHLTGHPGMEIPVLRRLHRLHPAAAGHPEARVHPAIGTTSGALGQGFANAVGMALAERLLAARFGRSLVDHRTWVIASGTALMEGLSHEAAAIAGRLKLARLTVLYDEREASEEGAPSRPASGDPLKRFAALGWAAKRVDGHSAAEIAGALSFALRSPRPTLIACRTAFGFGAPRPAERAAASGAPAQAQALRNRRAFGWTAAPFTIPEDIACAWKEAGARGAHARRAWLRRLAHHALRAEFERITAGRLPERLPAALAGCKAEFATHRAPLSTERASEKIVEALASSMRELVGGSTGAASAIFGGEPKSAGGASGFARRSIPYGAREHGMAGAMNGLARHGGIVPYGRAFLTCSDYMRPALRLAALMRARVIHVFTDDSIGLGDDGAAHQSVEHLASLRAIPNFFLFRPADAVETAECWELALARRDGPSALVVTREDLPTLRTNADANLSARGGYVLAGPRAAPAATLIASGAEVTVALAARDVLAARGIDAAVVSLPCWELFERQEPNYRAAVLGSALRVGIEAAGGFGWERWLGSEGVFVGIEGFGASGPRAALLEHFGITAEAVADAVGQRIG